MLAAVVALAPYQRSHYTKLPRSTSIHQGPAYLRELLKSDSEKRFYDIARMQRRTFLQLLHVLESTGLDATSDGVSSGEKRVIFLRRMCTTLFDSCENPPGPLDQPDPVAFSSANIQVEDVSLEMDCNCNEDEGPDCTANVA
ncbi:hypothetical protein PHYPSEUDO_001333 [Phytophthora pseudosyringae]|uniref:DUF8040 domain-containing protein n=1 Tax=Phytophthora pseudosyringae TaxID=221518 RepID=A0A8T1V539_9STRA|nr:hypothetical protein PHYPSEUDO_001333 [Phytophthora pseudosyringae]